LMHGGSSGAVIQAGEADSSQLFASVTHKSEPFMPQNADKLPDKEIDLIRRWINGGALENAGSKAAKPKAQVKIAAAGDSSKRPDVVPLPPRMVLEPAFEMAHSPMSRSLATSPWAPLVAVASQRQVLLYNTRTLELVGVYAFPEGQPNVVRFSRDGEFLMAGGGRPAASGKVVVWDITTGERVFEVGKELDAVLAADISPDHKRIALGGPQRIVRVYSTETGELQYEMKKHTDWVLTVEFSPDGVLLATADRNGGLVVWEADTGHEYLTMTGHTGAVNAVSWRGDSNVLASASEDATIRLWEMENGTAVKNWNAKAPIQAMNFTRDGRIVSGGRDQIARIWSPEGKQLAETARLGEVAVSVAYCNETHRLVAANLAGVVQVYNEQKPKLLGSLVTNPPTLDKRLVEAKKTLQQKTQAGQPLLASVHKAEAEASAAQTTLVSEREKLAKQKSDVDKLVAEIKQLTSTRMAKDNERTTSTASFQQFEAARPSVGEALRHLTEALGKLPGDTKLVATQSALSQQLKTMEASSAALRTKVNDLTAELAVADDKLRELNVRLDSANKEMTTASARIKSLEVRSQQLAAAADAARKTAAPIQAEITQAQTAVDRWQGELAFRDYIVALQRDLNSARKVAAERQSQVDKANAELADVEQSVKKAKAKLDAAATGVDALTARIQAARKPK